MNTKLVCLVPRKVIIKINSNGLNYSEYVTLFVIKLSLYYLILFLNLQFKEGETETQKSRVSKPVMGETKTRSLDS